jgi:hypothetical protein
VTLPPDTNLSQVFEIPSGLTATGTYFVAAFVAAPNGRQQKPYRYARFKVCRVGENAQRCHDSAGSYLPQRCARRDRLVLRGKCAALTAPIASLQ